MIEGSDQYPNMTVEVRNRNGEVVYSSNGYLNPWDGKHSRTGELLPTGSYYYIIDLGVGTTPLNGLINIVR